MANSGSWDKDGLISDQYMHIRNCSDGLVYTPEHMVKSALKYQNWSNRTDYVVQERKRLPENKLLEFFQLDRLLFRKKRFQQVILESIGIKKNGNIGICLMDYPS